MEPIVTVGIIDPLPEHAEAVEEALRAAVRSTHKEAGCELYALHKTLSDPVILVMIEQWASEGALADHLAGDGVKALLATLPGKLAKPPQVLRMAALPDGEAALGKLRP